MNKIKLLLLVLVASTATAFSQIVITNIMWTNESLEHVPMVNSFDLSYGDDKDVSWYYTQHFHDVFKRVSDITFGYTRAGEFFRAADYLDRNSERVHIQFFPQEEAIRVTYYDTNLVFEFFK
jgi:hypothetical protein